MELKVLATGSKGNCYILTSSKKEKLIIECGIGIKKILEGLEFDLNGVCGCLVTHEHKDHSKSIKDIAKRGIEVQKGIFGADMKVQLLNDGPVTIVMEK